MNISRFLALKTLIVVTVIFSCGFVSNQNNTLAVEKTTKEFNNYWFNGEAEITSFQLEQARYGEIHKGNSVMIFVTEPFSKEKQVKSDKPSANDESVLKLNFEKKFTTGIYPYSMLSSTFLPLSNLNMPLLKSTTSVQEWCGQVFIQINNKKDKWDIKSYSYFESDGDKEFKLEQNMLEDELWSKIRTNPDLLPVGKQKLIPSVFYTRLMHKDLKAYDVEIKKTVVQDNIDYTIYYPELKRTLSIHYKNAFPYSIEGWEEIYVSGWGEKAEILTTKATKLKRIKLDYWTKNKVEDANFRNELGLQ